MSLDVVAEYPLLDQLKDLAPDVDAINERLVGVFADPTSYKEIMGWRDEEAQYLINLLQTVRLHPMLNICSY